MDDVLDKRKAHRKRQAGPKADKKKAKHNVDQSLTAQQRNPRAFSIQHANKTLKTVRRTQDLKTKKQHIPVVDRTPLEPPPIVVGVVGPPKVGKTTLLKCVVKNYTKQKLTKIQGPVTVVSGKQRRLTLIECNNDISAMIDIAKVADLVLLLVDASFGFEMETFEFLNICQVHGFPRMMGVLTHLDTFKDCKKLRKTKKRLKNRFWTEVFQGAKLFYLSGLVNGEYQKTQIHNLCRFISVMKFRPLTWRTTHPYILADRMEDITDPETIRQSPKADRNISLYGYLHGTHMKNNINVHIPGCGDFTLHDVQFLSDPCPTPEKRKKRSLTDKDRIVYAPMSGVGGIVYDKDAVYIDLGGSHSHTNPEKDEDTPQPVNELVSSLLTLSDPLDKKMTTSEVALFSEGVKSSDTFNDEESEEEDHSGGRHFETVHTDGRVRRRAVFNNEDEKSKSEKSDESDDEDLDSDDSDDYSDDEDDELEKEENDPNDYDSDKMNDTKLQKQKEGKFPKEKLVFDESDEDDWEISFKQAKKQKAEIQDSDEEISFKQAKKQKAKIKDSDVGISFKQAKKQKVNIKDTEQKENQNSGIDSDSDNDIDEMEEYDSSDNELGEDDEVDEYVEKNNEDEEEEKDDDDDDDDGDDDDDDDNDDERKIGNVDVVHKKKANEIKSVKETAKDLNKVTKQETKSKPQNNNDNGSESGSSSEGDSSDTNKETSATSQNVSQVKQNIVNERTENVESLSQKLLALSETDYFSLNAKKKPVQRVSETDKKEELTEDVEMEDDEDEEDMKMDEEDEEDVSFRWKHDLASQAAANFRQRQASRVNYRKLIYGKDESETRDKDAEEEEDEIGGLFKVLKEKSEASSRAAVNSKDCSKCLINNLVKLDLEEIQDLIADCFVTGKWDDDKDAEALLKKDEELYGDFEDLETGESHSANQEEDESKEDADKDKQPEEVKKKKSEMTADERRAEKKRKLKEMFDTQYDMKGDTEFYDNWKEELEQQAKMNRAVFEDMDDELRVQYEGFRPGMYVRVEIHGVPCEFVINFDATYPLILGGLLSIENNVGYVQTRLKKHRWHKKILKTKNPLIFSLGWRRFQSIPLYFMQDHNMRNRLLKYTPEHLHCHSTFWGPITPQGTGLLAVENVANITPDFRIAATGVVLELDKSQQIVKKLKLTGTPLKIYNKTAFIQGMFNTALEVAKFEGASVRTVSGLRGQIKKAVKTPEGAFRATFEDKILLSDIVFLRTWYPVEVPQFYNPVTTLLLPRSEKKGWTGLKTLGQLYREKNMKPVVSDDSRYKKVERKAKIYTPLSIPKSLQKVLPFESTPKSLLTKKDPIERVAVLREPHEAKVAKMMSMLKSVYEHKNRTGRMKMKERVTEHKKQMQKLDNEKRMKLREAKKQVFKMLGKMGKGKSKKK